MTRDVLRDLARPRLFGTAGATHVATLVRARLEAAGLAVEVQGFRFSTWPGRFAVPVLGAVLLCAFAGAALLGLRDQAASAAAVLAATMLVLLPVPFLAGPAVMHLPFGRATGMNLLAVRPGATPRFLVVAHRDSKSQPVPLGLRIAAAAVVLFALPGALVAAVSGVVTVTLALSAAGIAASAILLACGVGNASPGALDNATGLAALLELAVREKAGDVAFLVTDAEELALAGGRAAARAWTHAEAVINLDGLDDEGPLRILVGRGRAAVLRAAPLQEALAAAARDRGQAVGTHTVPAGLMVDHLPFAAAGAPALTVMRGHTTALATVHRRKDAVGRLTGAGSMQVAAVVTAALATLRERTPSG